MNFFHSLTNREGKPVQQVLPLDPKFFDGLPALWAFMTADEYEPGQPRERSSLTLFIENGAFKFYLAEKTKGAGIDATGATVADALAALELRLTSAAPGWRETAKKKGKK
jgi:hypothetical protein